MTFFVVDLGEEKVVALADFAVACSEQWDRAEQPAISIWHLAKPNWPRPGWRT